MVFDTTLLMLPRPPPPSPSPFSPVSIKERAGAVESEDVRGNLCSAIPVNLRRLTASHTDRKDPRSRKATRFRMASCFKMAPWYRTTAGEVTAAAATATTQERVMTLSTRIIQFPFSSGLRLRRLLEELARQTAAGESPCLTGTKG